jgi:hypothetical protein
MTLQAGARLCLLRPAQLMLAALIVLLVTGCRTCRCPAGGMGRGMTRAAAQ